MTPDGISALVLAIVAAVFSAGSLVVSIVALVSTSRAAKRQEIIAESNRRDAIIRAERERILGGPLPGIGFAAENEQSDDDELRLVLKVLVGNKGRGETQLTGVGVSYVTKDGWERHVLRGFKNPVPLRPDTPPQNLILSRQLVQFVLDDADERALIHPSCVVGGEQLSGAPFTREQFTATSSGAPSSNKRFRVMDFPLDEGVAYVRQAFLIPSKEGTAYELDDVKFVSMLEVQLFPDEPAA